MLNQYDDASDGKMKNLAIWSRKLRLAPTIMVLRNLRTDLHQGVKNVLPKIAK
jgi:hypothetical protein